MTAGTVRSTNATNETSTVNSPTSHHPSTPQGQVEWHFRIQCLVALQAAFSCVTFAGTAQWLCWLPIDGRLRLCQRTSLATPNAPNQNTFLNYVIASGKISSLVSRHESPDRNIGWCCVTFWNCGSAISLLWIFWRISNLHMYVCICRCNIKQPAALHLRRNQLDSLCAVVRQNM